MEDPEWEPKPAVIRDPRDVPCGDLAATRRARSRPWVDWMKAALAIALIVGSFVGIPLALSGGCDPDNDPDDKATTEQRPFGEMWEERQLVNGADGKTYLLAGGRLYEIRDGQAREILPTPATAPVSSR
jgi:hypothetical protein